MSRTPLMALALLTANFVVSEAVSGQELEAVAGRSPSEGERVVLVTGSTGGLGREVARRLAARGDHVIVHGRSLVRGAELVAEIEAEGQGSARLYLADLGSFDEVRALARAILRDYDRLEVCTRCMTHQFVAHGDQDQSGEVVLTVYGNIGKRICDTTCQHCA